MYCKIELNALAVMAIVLFLRPPRIARPGTVIVNRLVSSTAEFGHLHQLVKISIRENKYWK